MIFEQIKITDVLVIAGLIVALLMAIFYHMNELAMSIASGMIGYIGGSARMTTHPENKNKNEKDG